MTIKNKIIFNEITDDKYINEIKNNSILRYGIKLN
jgi:hypothetical protein